MAHDLHSYMVQLGAKMEAEYARIRKCATSDPGTAGDEGEENWAQLLREWLPPAYQVVTKGQLIDEDGDLSPQIDVIVLKPAYPMALHHRKKYLIAGVAAAFECKLTLKKTHIEQAIATSAAVKRLSGSEKGSPYKELVTGPVFGLVAHAHSWAKSSDAAYATNIIDEHIVSADRRNVKHPREMLDLICVADLATWVTSKMPLFDPENEVDDESRAKLDPNGVPATNYMCHSGYGAATGRDGSPFSPIGVFISELLVKLAWQDISLRDIASYFVGVEFSSHASGHSRHWTREIYSRRLRRRLTLKSLKPEISWNEWAAIIQ
jgi:hypothetical protein